MTAPEHTAQRVLARRTGPAAGAGAIAAAADRACDDLAQVLAPVIGDFGGLWTCCCFGSNTHHVISAASCPVLIVRG